MNTSDNAMYFRREEMLKSYPQTADIFLVPGRGKIGHRLIEHFQKYGECLPRPFWEFVHVGIVSDWPKGVHSTFSAGVHLLPDIPMSYPDAVILRHEDLVGAEMSDTRNKIRGDLLELCANGRGYDWISILDFVLHSIPAVLREMLYEGVPNYSELYLFCSELVVRAYRERGIQVCGTIDAERVSPGRLAMDPAMILVGRAAEFIDIPVAERDEYDYLACVRAQAGVWS